MRILKICFLELHFLFLLITPIITSAAEKAEFSYEYNGKRYSTKPIELPADIKDCYEDPVFAMMRYKRNRDKIVELPNCDEQKKKLFNAFEKKVIDSEIAILKKEELIKQEAEIKRINYNNDRIGLICNLKFVTHPYMIEQIASQANVHPKTVDLKDFGVVETGGFKKCTGKFYHPNGVSTLDIYYPVFGEEYRIYPYHLNAKNPIQNNSPPATYKWNFNCMKLVC